MTRFLQASVFRVMIAALIGAIAAYGIRQFLPVSSAAAAPSPTNSALLLVVFFVTFAVSRYLLGLGRPKD